MEVDPTSLTIYERLTKYPDSYTDEELRYIIEWYSENDNRSGLWGRFPVMAFLILEEREKNNYTKEEI